MRKIIFFLALAMILTAQSAYGFQMDLTKLTTEDKANIKIFEEAYITSTVESFEDPSKACGYIVINTTDLCAKQDVDVDFIVTDSHVLPVIKTSQGYYGLQHYQLYRYTSYNRNWVDKMIYDSCTWKTTNGGGAYLTNRVRKEYADVFVDCVYDPRLAAYEYLSYKKSHLEKGKIVGLARAEILYGGIAHNSAYAQSLEGIN